MVWLISSNHSHYPLGIILSFLLWFVALMVWFLPLRAAVEPTKKLCRPPFSIFLVNEGSLIILLVMTERASVSLLTFSEWSLLLPYLEHSRVALRLSIHLSRHAYLFCFESLSASSFYFCCLTQNLRRTSLIFRWYVCDKISTILPFGGPLGLPKVTYSNSNCDPYSFLIPLL